MTVPATAVPLPLRSAVMSAYEDLRRSALAGGIHGEGTAGLALFIGRGMARWMATSIQVLERLAMSTAPAPRSAPEHHHLDPGLRGQVAMLLAQMALAANVQGATTC